MFHINLFKKLLDKILNLKRIFKQFIVFVLDIFSSCLSYIIAFYLRLDLSHSFTLNDFIVIGTSNNIFFSYILLWRFI